MLSRRYVLNRWYSKRFFCRSGRVFLSYSTLTVTLLHTNTTTKTKRIPKSKFKVHMTFYLQIKIVCGLVEEWDGPPEKVDLIVLSHVMYYIEDVGALLSNMLSWLNPTGRILMFTNDRYEVQVRIGISSYGCKCLLVIPSSSVMSHHHHGHLLPLPPHSLHHYMVIALFSFTSSFSFSSSSCF